MTATGSCEVCVQDPANELCQYGMNSVKLSRQFEGSGVRVRRALEKALRGEEIGIGILGASVTAGKSPVGPSLLVAISRFSSKLIPLFLLEI